VSELSKWSAAQPTLHAIRDFLDWCETQNIDLALPTPSGKWLQPVMENRESMLARYLEIDTTKLENERRALLKRCRSGPQ